jgi:hypothetical protein
MENLEFENEGYRNMQPFYVVFVLFATAVAEQWQSQRQSAIFTPAPHSLRYQPSPKVLGAVQT